MAHVDAALADHYGGFYTGTDPWRELGAIDKSDNVVRLATRAGLPKPTVVDIGCGEGSLAAALARLGFFDTYCGIDLSASAIAGATDRRVPRAEFSTFDGSRFDVPDKTYDLAVLSHVIEHLEHPRVLLAEAARLARFVFVEVPLELHRRTPKHFRWTPTGHINLYNATVIRHLIQSVGLEVLHEQITNPSRAALSYQTSKAKGTARWALREATLRVSPRLAASIFTYHDALIAQPSPNDQVAAS